jgi:hypothetical protein
MTHIIVEYNLFEECKVALLPYADGIVKLKLVRSNNKVGTLGERTPYQIQLSSNQEQTLLTVMRVWNLSSDT